MRRFLSLLEAKRDGLPLSTQDIQDIVRGCVAGEIPDYQLAAFLMAVFFQGLTSDETRALTLAMRDSGDVLAFPEAGGPVVDKHSTGGVGDKVSLPLVPLLACLGFRVPMISGRGLGLTGGTLDKLESIPGFSTALEKARIIRQVEEIGCAMGGQTPRLVPADRVLYALRDVTGTVPSIALITASILSKKLAEGLSALVLDVKCGEAAFMRTLPQARTLARSMVDLGAACGLSARALITDMNQPLGRAAGNWLEVREAVDCLEGRGPEDLRVLVLDSAAHLLVQTGRAETLERARTRAEDTLRSGQPRARWDALLRAQGADLDAFERKLARDHTAPVVLDICAPRAGFVGAPRARELGEVVRDLGGGRLSRESAIDPEVGIDRLVQTGEQLDAHQPVCRVHARSLEDAQGARDRILEAVPIGDAPPVPRRLVLETLTA